MIIFSTTIIFIIIAFILKIFIFYSDYVTGFRKRKKERKERAAKYNEARAKKELKEARVQVINK